MFSASPTLSYAQSDPGGPGTPRPAASSASSKSSKDTSGMAPNKSGSETSTSGGSDVNGDQGRDKAPDSGTVKPNHSRGIRSTVAPAQSFGHLLVGVVEAEPVRTRPWIVGAK
jgi:hypothetical protein